MFYHQHLSWSYGFVSMLLQMVAYILRLINLAASRGFFNQTKQIYTPKLYIITPLEAVLLWNEFWIYFLDRSPFWTLLPHTVLIHCPRAIPAFSIIAVKILIWPESSCVQASPPTSSSSLPVWSPDLTHRKDTQRHRKSLIALCRYYSLKQYLYFQFWAVLFLNLLLVFFTHLLLFNVWNRVGFSLCLWEFSISSFHDLLTFFPLSKRSGLGEDR